MKYKEGIDSEGLSKELIKTIKNAERIAGFEFTITSAKRSGDGSSSHDHGLAVDIRADSGWHRWTIVESLKEVGIERIGVYDKHIHADIDVDRGAPVMWSGVSR